MLPGFAWQPIQASLSTILVKCSSDHIKILNAASSPDLSLDVNREVFGQLNLLRCCQ